MNNSRTYGYARVSCKDQNEKRQIKALLDSGVEERFLFVDKASGKDFNREQYQVLKNALRFSDILVIKSIDRLGRNYNMIIEEWRDITKNIGAKIKVLDLPMLNTNENELITTVINDIVIGLLSYVAEQERAFLKQRQREGIIIAKSKNVRFGRPKIKKPDNFDEIIKTWENKKITARKAMQTLNLKPNTFYNMVKEYGESDK